MAKQIGIEDLLNVRRDEFVQCKKCDYQWMVRMKKVEASVNCPRCNGPAVRTMELLPHIRR